MKSGLMLLLDVLGRLVYLAGSSLLILLMGGGFHLFKSQWGSCI